MHNVQLRKIEEHTLYLIQGFEERKEMQKEINELKTQNDHLRNELETIKSEIAAIKAKINE